MNCCLQIRQSDVRANHSTDTCFSRLADIMLNGAENGKHTGMILINLRKSFDTLDHKNFSEKMKCIGLLDQRIK